MRMDKLQWIEKKNNIHFECSVDIAIHRANSPVITLIIPGVDGSVDGFNGKYRICAENLYKTHGSAVIRMNNPFIATSFWESNLRRVLEYVLDHSAKICDHEKPELRIMAHSAGASVVAHIAWEYPAIKRLLLINTAAALQKDRICSGLERFNGDRISIIYGDKDPSVEHAHTFYSYSKKERSELYIVENADHHFSQKTALFIDLPNRHLF